MLNNLAETIQKVILSMGVWAPFFACLLICVESFIPMLPLCAFITINILKFGIFFGYVISWLCTCLGCFLSFYLFRKLKSNRIVKILNQYKFAYVKPPSIQNTIVLMSLPFTPSFMLNIALSLSDISFKKFAIMVFISKIFVVYFWGFIGVGIVQSITSFFVLIKVILMMLIAFVISKIVK